MRIEALEKLTKEAELSKNQTIHVIHNWLSDQDDTELFEGICKDERTMQGALNYCSSKAASSEYKSGNSAMVDNDTVFKWIVEYYKSEKVKNVQPVANVKTADIPKVNPVEKKAKKAVKKYASSEKQISLFEL